MNITFTLKILADCQYLIFVIIQSVNIYLIYYVGIFIINKLYKFTIYNVWCQFEIKNYRFYKV